MTQLLDPATAVPPHDVAAAEAAADAAARAAGCVVRPLHRLDDLRGVVGVFRDVWGRDGHSDLLPLELLRALSHAGNHAAGAFVAGELIGAVVGFLGQVDGSLTLHSHVMGLVPGRRSRGVGFALKQQQRAWALARGIETVTWTFDPLVRQNAYFNLHKLGAEATAYHPDFYGALEDDINRGEPSDRLLVTWRLRSERAVAASHLDPVPTADAAPALVLLEPDGDDRPVRRRGDADRYLVRVPADIVGVRARDAALAHEWRLAVRDTLGATLGDGFHATIPDRAGGYLLTPDRDTTPTEDRP